MKRSEARTRVCAPRRSHAERWSSAPAYRVKSLAIHATLETIRSDSRSIRTAVENRLLGRTSHPLVTARRTTSLPAAVRRPAHASARASSAHPARPARIGRFRAKSTSILAQNCTHVTKRPQMSWAVSLSAVNACLSKRRPPNIDGRATKRYPAERPDPRRSGCAQGNGRRSR